MEAVSSLLNRKRGCLLGVAVGDALGLPFEFLSTEELAERHGRKPVREMIGGGWSHARAGAVSDDTEMTLILGHSLLEQGGYSRDVVAKAYLDWAATGSPYVGRIVKSVLFKINEGVSSADAARLYHEESEGQTAGNGALMRLSPLVLYYLDDPAEMKRMVTLDTQLTHHHPLALEASLAYASKLAELLGGEPFGLPALSEETEQALRATPAQAAKRIESEGGFVLASLAASCAALTFPSLEEALVWVVNHGGDADTNGACAGALLGARDGASAIPARWLEQLSCRTEVEALADEL